MGNWEAFLDAPDIRGSAQDIGPGHIVVPRRLDGVLHGFDEWHQHPTTGNPCGGWVPINFDGETRHWDMLSENPLTLSPSLQCGTCPSHGWIRDGRWVDA